MSKEIKYSIEFKKQFQKRILPFPKVRKKFYNRVQLFLDNKTSPLLRDHLLRGKLQDFRSFSIANDLRIIYQEFDDCYIFLKIGSHNQIY